MKTATLKKEIYQAIDNTSDNEILTAVHTILKKASPEETSNITISEKQIELLDERWNDYKKGKVTTLSLEEASLLVKKHLKTIKR